MAQEKILLVEDEKLIRWSLANRLSKEGYSVVEVDRGSEALKALEENEIDLVLLDYRLPDTDGIHVLKNIGPRFRDLPVIMMTAYSTVESAIEAMKLGAFDYLNKPFEIDELICVMCGMCAARCPAELAPFNIALPPFFSFSKRHFFALK